MNIDILTVWGSPKGVNPTEIEIQGCGGAELALMNLMETLAKRGHTVRIYNNSRKIGLIGNVWYFNDLDYNPYDDKRDILITYRGPQELSAMSKKKKHIAFSTDQYTMGDYRNWHNEVDKFVVISEYHKNDHINRYSINPNKIIISDLGILSEEYNKTLEKITNQCIFCSVPDRGLSYLVSIWPQIKICVPDATLIITSDYTLWGSHDPLNMEYRLQFAGMQGVTFLGKVPRSKLVELQLQSELQIYPCRYEELFCIANAECQSAGNYTVTSNMGALQTTNFTGKRIDHYPGSAEFTAEFIEGVISFMKMNKEEKNVLLLEDIKKNALNRFNWKHIADYWESNILNI